MKYTTSSLVLGALFASEAQAWWGNGHLLVARIGYDLLQNESPDTLDNVNSILSVLKHSDPSWTVKENDYPFVECTTFGDDIKYKGGSYQSNWHFVDTPYLDKGGDISDYDFKPDSHNATEAIGALVDWFNKADGYDSTY
mmetsp:Transcript_8717/g.14790  ORF Transcript_8717/g.14790 Transcript_8717/m.14790 type:complete len:140 (+) Transcript_8717:40-459(+)